VEAAGADLERRVHTLQELSQSLERLHRRQAELAIEETRIRAALAQAQQDHARAETLLQDEPLIREQLAALQAARQANDRLGLLFQRYSALQQQAANALAAIEQEKALLTQRQRTVQQTLTTAEQSAATLRQRRTDLEALRREAVLLPPLEARLEALSSQDTQISQQISAHGAATETLAQQLKALRGKYKQLKQLKGVPICPVCQSELSPEQHQQVLAAYEEEGTTYNAQITEHETLQRSLQQEQATLRQDLAGVQREVQRLRTLCHGEGKLEAQVAELERAAQTGNEAAEQVAALTAMLSLEDFAPEARAALAQFEAALLDLGYDASAHQEIQHRVAALAPVERRVDDLERAREARQTAALAVQRHEISLAAALAERDRVAADRGPLEAATADLPSLLAAAAAEREKLQQLRAAEAALHQQLGSLRRQIDEGRARIAEREAALAARKLAEQQIWVHRELGVIFGKRGVQAMLIENALPELEEDANELLARMTDNSTQVHFATQRQGTGGKAIETLEIKIADNMGTRTYEMFSGGEAFRINFAIRIALSRLLARRAGADLSFLLIDEGFGTQDTQGRDRLVEAITSIADDFEKILVVTHIDELKELFDVHIEVSKGPAGSQITISAA
jgi:exonuclease SbcC